MKATKNTFIYDSMDWSTDQGITSICQICVIVLSLYILLLTSTTNRIYFFKCWQKANWRLLSDQIEVVAQSGIFWILMIISFLSRTQLWMNDRNKRSKHYLEHMLLTQINSPPLAICLATTWPVFDSDSIEETEGGMVVLHEKGHHTHCHMRA